MDYYKRANIHTAAAADCDTSILIIYTGGTIGMGYAPDGDCLVPFDFTKIIEKIPELCRFEFELTVLSLDPVVDSSNMNPDHWLNLARIIFDFYNDYDAFVILHGTDTMAYTASGLSFLLKNLSKPVIFTGSQLPIAVSRTDARENLISALEIADARKADGKPMVTEVCIYFDSVLLRGNRSRKTQSEKFKAFESKNFSPLARAGVSIEFNEQLMLPYPKKSFRIYDRIDAEVFLIKIFPGMNRHYLESLLCFPELKGIILETFGSGNAPTDRYFLDMLQGAAEKGIIIYNISQCYGGRIKQGSYETGRRMADSGVVGGSDITPEAALAKMKFLLANESDTASIRKMLKIPLRGELSPTKD